MKPTIITLEVYQCEVCDYQSKNIVAFEKCNKCGKYVCDECRTVHIVEELECNSHEGVYANRGYIDYCHGCINKEEYYAKIQEIIDVANIQINQLNNEYDIKEKLIRDWD